MLAPTLTRLRAVSALAAALAFALPAAAAVPLPDGGRVEKVDFERHVMGLFGRAGCNSGSCHGSFQGRGGFRLSLFGYDPDKDYLALTRDALGRRVNTADPDASLLLLKATGAVEHGGGRRFGRDSWQYRVFREWIVDGAPWTPGSGAVKAVAVTPPELALARPGTTGQLAVKATFADGSVEDITPFCEFRTNDDAVAEVTNVGQIKGLRAGDTAVIVSYRGNVLPVRVLVPYAADAAFSYPKVPEVNYVDRHVFAKLRRLNIVPSDLADDAAFLRRVTIDTIGSLPSPEEVRAFVADRDPKKREKKIDQLLAHPLHAALWATKFCDITGNNTDALENPQQTRAKRSQMWHDWLRKRLAEDRPYDEIVRGILCATTREGKSPEKWVKAEKALEEEMDKGFDTDYADRATLDLFWRRQQPVTIDQWGEKVAAAFMGVRLECAQCHKHPFDRWTQTDYRAFANVFVPVAFGVSPEAKTLLTTENAERQKAAKGKQQAILREVFVNNGGTLPGGKGQVQGKALPNPDTGRPLPPKCPGGPEVVTRAGEDPRVQVFEWLRSPDNPWFARAFVNRVWGHYFGVGIVDPVDNFSLANPPSDPALLDALAKDFVAHRYDIRAIERTVLLSRAYQLSSDTNATNKLDRNNYSHSYLRPMMAEVVVDVLDDALGAKEDFGKDVARPGARAIEVGASRVANGNLNYAFRIFGRPPRTTACDCERAMEPALPQKLFFMVDQAVLGKVRMPKGRLERLLAGKKSDAEITDELFLATLSRLPNDKDRALVAERLRHAKSRAEAFADVTWALINTREFVLNH
ncbi:MAG TPA: DUF1549 and DUF1553 domain-containing protein [Gemmataceae bacterium]|nr:DUF1549 and DUF1553 domain-containing protein [Gemmataceae bacterium]